LAPLKRKGDLAELNVAADLLARGCRLSFRLDRTATTTWSLTSRESSIAFRSSTPSPTSPQIAATTLTLVNSAAAGAI